MKGKKKIHRDPEFGLHIFIICLFISALIIIFFYLTNKIFPLEKFFSLSGALYGPKVIPDNDKCLCSQYIGSEETFPKKSVSMNKCASCHTG